MLLPVALPADVPALPVAALVALAEGNDQDVLSGPTATGLPASVGLRERLGTLVLPSGEHLALTATDALWTARMLDGEGGEGEGNAQEKAALVWTLAQRRYWGSADGPRPSPSFSGMGWSSFLQGFSQAINPKWRADGEFCRPGGRYAGTANCSAQKLARRARLASAPWDSLSAASRDVAVAFATGVLPNPVPGAINFGARSLATSLPQLATQGFDNVFYFSQAGATGGSRAWAGAGIGVSPAEDTSFVASLVPGAQGLIDRVLGSGGSP